MAWPASIPTFLTGIGGVTVAKLNQLRDALKAIGDPWTAYTPTWSATTTNPTLNNGTLSGAYIQAGKLIHFRVVLTFGSTTNPGSGGWYFTLPAVPNLPGYVAIDSGAFAYDTSATGRRSGTVVTQDGTGRIYLIDGSGGVIGSAAPWAWANGDSLSFAGSYEAA